MSINEEELIARIKERRCQHAFSYLVKLYQSDVRQLLRKLTSPDLDAADDLAQETFIKAFNGIKNFKGDSGFKTWLFRIAWNVYRDAYRAQKRRPLDYRDDLPDTEDTQDMQASLKNEALERALGELPSEQRMTIYLCLQQEMTQQEASNVMGLPLGTIKSHVTRGKAKLAELLSGWRGD